MAEKREEVAYLLHEGTEAPKALNTVKSNKEREAFTINHARTEFCKKSVFIDCQKMLNKLVKK